MAIKKIYWDGTNVFRNDGDRVPFHAEDVDLIDCCDCCPGDCGDCPSTGTLSISGLTGQCPPGQNCTGLNGSYDIVQIGAPNCVWAGQNQPWFTADVQCVVDAGVVYWEVSGGIMFNLCAVWRQVATTLCPPGGGWVWSSGVCAPGAVSIAWD